MIVLDELRDSRAVIDGEHIDLTLTDQPTALAICAAESWLQLSRMLNETVRVRAGVADPVNGRRVPRAVPPLCAVCRLAERPAFSWRREADGDLTIVARFDPDRAGLPDPDLLQIGDWRPGSPARITWRGNLFGSEPSVESEIWASMAPELLAGPHHVQDDPYGRFAGLLGHGASGNLEWRFTGAAALAFTAAAEISGRFLDGRPFRTELQLAPDPQNTPMAAADEATGLLSSSQAEPDGAANDPLQLIADRSRPLALSPELLEGWPNPFRDAIRIRFEVPGTLARTFDWDKLDDPPAVTELDAAMPWPSGTPQVTVKIYSLNGQELVSLRSAHLGPGSYHVQWDGTDAFGRQVASGTYFCKLQMDTWSVTRRLVYLR